MSIQSNRMPGRRTLKAVILLLISLGLCAAAGCEGPSTSGESHFGTTKALFRVCTDGQCESGDSCACAVCTVPCQDIADCAERILGPGKVAADLKGDVVCQAPACFAPGDSEAGDGGPGSVCEVLCESDPDCDFITESTGTHVCIAGYCRSREEPQSPVAAPVLGPACPAGRTLVPHEALNSDVGLCVDTEEVTVAEYRGCVDAGECSAPIAGNFLTAMRDTHPVHFVEPAQAELFCAFEGGRLPSREEWEATARGTEPAGDYPFGATEPALGDLPPRVCAFEETTTCEVGVFAGGDGPFGHSDLSGNVAELVIDGDALCAAGGHYASDAIGLTVDSCVAAPNPDATVGFRCASDL